MAQSSRTPIARQAGRIIDRVTGPDGDLAAQVWRALYDLSRAHFERHLQAGAEIGLTPGDLKGLLWLTPGEPVSMRALADQWGTDASTMTWLIDRLEQRGLVARRPHATDRRVRVVLLTEAGERARADLLDQLYRPPPAFAELSRAQLRALAALVPKLTP
jgi:DNA-binding MarR family transcriptional regulator